MSAPLRRSPRNHKSSSREDDTVNRRRVKAGPSAARMAEAATPAAATPARTPAHRAVLPPAADKTKGLEKATAERPVAARLVPVAGSVPDFALVRLLGKGATAHVYEAMKSQKTRVALKRIQRTALGTFKAQQRLVEEVRIQSSLKHPNVVRLRNHFYDPNSVWIELELCPHGSLEALLNMRSQLTEPEARFLMVQLLGACHYLHGRGIIHRDLKPANILFDDKMNLKVADFGCSAIQVHPSENRRTFCGTPLYISPEMIQGPAGHGHGTSVDMWAVGAILYTLLYGYSPFYDESLRVRDVYRRVQHCNYSFPTHGVSVFALAQAVVASLLKLSNRPTAAQVIGHTWFLAGRIPHTLSHDIGVRPTNVSALSDTQSAANLEAAIEKSGLVICRSA